MNNLADVVLEYFWFLNFGSDDELDPDTAVKAMENLAYTIDTTFTDSEKAALRDAAQRSLAEWLREPDEHGYTTEASDCRKSGVPRIDCCRAFLWTASGT